MIIIIIIVVVVDDVVYLLPAESMRDELISGGAGCMRGRIGKKSRVRFVYPCFVFNVFYCVA